MRVPRNKEPKSTTDRAKASRSQSILMNSYLTGAGFLKDEDIPVLTHFRLSLEQQAQLF